MMRSAQRAMRLAAKRLRKLLRRPEDAELVRLHSSAPTVPKEATAKLGKRWVEDNEDTWVKPINYEDLPS